MPFALLAWGLSLATGWGLLEILWPIRDTRGAARDIGELVLRVGLALGLGLLASSVCYLLLMRLGMVSFAGLLGGDLVLAAAALAVARMKQKATPLPSELIVERDDGVGIVSLVLLVGLTAAIFLAVAFAFRAHQTTPLGAWDAFAIWNLKARFFYDLDGASWLAAFSSKIAWSHTDYPLLVPLGVARIWTYAGSESLALSAMQSVLFAFLTACVLFGTVARLRGLVSGCLALATLIASQAALRASVDQLADIPVGFFFLAALAVLVLLTESETVGVRGPQLVGILAGAAAWTKNEGLLLLVACGVGLMLIRASDRDQSRARQGLGFALGLAVPLACVVYFKLALGGESDLLAGQSAEPVGKLFDPARHAAILISFGRTALALMGAPLVAILGLLVFLLRKSPPAHSPDGFRRLALALAIQLAGLYFVYLTTPRDLDWQLGSSNLRLFIQLWPSAVLLLFVWLGRSGQVLSGLNEGGAN